jgi:hypothetical protein
VSAGEGVENTHISKLGSMFGRCMTDSLCRGMPLMIVVLDFATHAQPGHHIFCFTAAEGQAARMFIGGGGVDRWLRLFLSHGLRLGGRLRW